MNRGILLVLALLLTPLLACVAYIRDPENLELEVVEIIEANEDSLVDCYEKQLANTQFKIESIERSKQGPYADIGPAVSKHVAQFNGTVVLSFFVEKKTGNFSHPRVEPTNTASQPLVQCVIDSLNDLKLEPVDQRTGKVTLAWDFKVGKHKGPRPLDIDSKSAVN